MPLFLLPPTAQHVAAGCNVPLQENLCWETWGVIPTSLSIWTYGLLQTPELLAVLPVPGSTAASAVFIGAPPMKMFEPKHRARRTAPPARARVLPETGETLTREV